MTNEELRFARAFETLLERVAKALDKIAKNTEVEDEEREDPKVRGFRPGGTAK